MWSNLILQTSLHYPSLHYPPLDEKLVKSLSRVQLFAITWTVAHQAPPSMGFSRQEYWGGLPFPSPTPGWKHFLIDFSEPATLCLVGTIYSDFLMLWQLGGYLLVCWYSLSLPVRWGYPQHAKASLASDMGSLMTHFMIWPMITILVTAPDAGFHRGTSGGPKTLLGPAVITKVFTNCQVKAWSNQDARGASCVFKERKYGRNYGREQNSGGVGGPGEDLSPRIHQEHTFRDRSACRTPAESGHENLNSGKKYIDPHKTQQDEGARGKTGVLVGLDLPSAGRGTEAGVQSPHQGNCLSQRRNT